MTEDDKAIAAAAGIAPGRGLKAKRMPYSGTVSARLTQAANAEQHMADMEANFRRLFPDAIIER
jgi:hypothetical protein